MEFFNLIADSMPLLLQGVQKTIELALLSLLLATTLGLVFGIMRVSKKAYLQVPAKVYVSIIRGTPLYVQIIFFYFGLFPLIFGRATSPITAGIFVLSLHAGAYLVEIFRAGIESIDRGQFEAGRALGFTHGQTMRYIILPQAIKRMIPAFVNQFIISIKDTSLLATIGIAELTYSAQTIYAVNFKAFEFLAAVGVMYWVIINALTWFSHWIERRLSAV
ncbi:MULTISPECIES: amino acid ABC transporter permease [Bacillaceae]|uniref:Amino acid ABC transporter permease n=1 Tax=Pseudobacillus wudalianchiensis TaxID=1743143 RepID=A0A1B9AY82_9BACI|nr:MULTISPECIES: amino acid ABC transporter permease [Bacillus]KMY55589.1 amino acid ABC transporter permease [Bacillus sp. FJAT-27231]OCA88935.1 amino acid ABC transporter permease [Bacillus wudalianchiensis]